MISGYITLIPLCSHAKATIGSPFRWLCATHAQSFNKYCFICHIKMVPLTSADISLVPLVSHCKTWMVSLCPSLILQRKQNATVVCHYSYIDLPNQIITVPFICYYSNITCKADPICNLSEHFLRCTPIYVTTNVSLFFLFFFQVKLWANVTHLYETFYRI